MAAHKSAISIGLIFVPVSLSKTTRETGISFNQLCKDENGKYQRIRYKKICPSCNVEIQSNDIIKGYEYEKGKYKFTCYLMGKRLFSIKLNVTTIFID